MKLRVNYLTRSRELLAEQDQRGMVKVSSNFICFYGLSSLSGLFEAESYFALKALIFFWQLIIAFAVL